MFEWLAPLMVGLLASVHCLGMCGPLVVAYSLQMRSGEDEGPPGWVSWTRTGFTHHVAFHSGRIFTYSLLGAMVAGLFRVTEVSEFFTQAHGGLRIVAGGILILLGLMILKILPFPKWLTSVSLAPQSFWGRHLPPLLHSRRVASKMALGMATGLLPCAVSWAMLVTAASTQDPLKGWFTMLMFGAGTVPLLLLTGLSAHLLSLRIRFLGERMAAITVIGMGLLMVVEGYSGHGCCQIG